MQSNRISRYLDADLSASFPQWQAAHATSAVTVGGGSQSGSMVLIPGVVQTSWQAQVYRLAYEKALADTAPPRHLSRFFSVWN
jgi:hypothetical protein